jgi:membrane-associated phospholipid phosphatase
MSDPSTNPAPSDVERSERTVTEAIAAPVATRRSDQSRWVDVLMELGALDRAVYEAVATTPTAHLDVPFRRLSRAADGGALWLVIAAAVATTRRARGRRVAGEGLASLAITAVTVNLGAKAVFRRRRPDRAGHDRTPARRVPTPSSTSFPSGHSATSFAFAYTISRHLPLLGVPIRLVAAAVAYSRVHIGVHYPGDVIIGSIMGAGTAAAVGSAWDHRRR